MNTSHFGISIKFQEVLIMGKYVEGSLNRGETVVKQAELNPLALAVVWLKGIAFFWLLLVPTIKAIIATFKFLNTELVLTNKRVVGKVGGLFSGTDALDTPLDKIQNVNVKQSFGGKIFNYADITISTAAVQFKFERIKNADKFKNLLSAQIDQVEEERLQQQAEEMAKAMSAAIKGNN